MKQTKKTLSCLDDQKKMILGKLEGLRGKRKMPVAEIAALNQTAQTLGTLPEGVKLTYDSSKHTIYADIKGNCGMIIIVE